VRLLMISSSFSPVIGGAESYAMDLARGLAARGHELTVATDVPHGREPEEDFADPDDFTVRRFSEYRRTLEDRSKIRWEQMAFGLMGELAACAEECRPELILTNSLDAAPLGKILALELSLPWVAAFHENAPEDEPLARGRLRFAYGILRPSLVLAGSSFYAERARRWGGDVPLRLVHHGVDTESFRPEIDGVAMRRAYGYDAEDLVVVSAGRLKPRKGIHHLIEAFASVRKHDPRARLLVVGSTSSASAEYALSLEREIERLRLHDFVTIDRTVTFDRMPAVLAAADVVVQPSLEEGLGLSVLEAMSAGRATVVTDVVGIREILSGADDVALTVPPAQPPALAEAISSLLRDPRRRADLGARARAHVEECFSRRSMIAETERALRRTLDARSERESAHV
jgi:glycosyltransferase involved in cell wall biosynthesis